MVICYQIMLLHVNNHVSVSGFYLNCLPLRISLCNWMISEAKNR